MCVCVCVDAFATAHLFMPKKDEGSYSPASVQAAVAQTAYQPVAASTAGLSGALADASQAAAALVNGAMPQPGKPYRWVLGDDMRGMQV